jgi:hypothetical protein
VKNISCSLFRLGSLFTMFAFAAVCLGAEFTADFTDDDTNRDDPNLSGKIYVKGDKTRREFVKDGKVAEIMIQRMDKGVTWIIDTEEKSYMQMKLFDIADTSGISKQIKTVATIKEAGEEKVNGVPCRKTIYTYKEKTLGSFTSWVAKSVNYQIKMEARSSYSTVKIEMKNIKQTKLPDDLFELPKGYTKSMDM